MPLYSFRVLLKIGIKIMQSEKNICVSYGMCHVRKNSNMISVPYTGRNSSILCMLKVMTIGALNVKYCMQRDVFSVLLKILLMTLLLEIV